MTIRVRLTGGYTELNIAGFKYLPDETGAFELPDDIAHEMLRVHGGQKEASGDALEQAVKDAEAALAAAKNSVGIREQELVNARRNFEAFKAQRHQAKMAAAKKLEDEELAKMAAEDAARKMTDVKKQPGQNSKP
jgi:hypothetical protein